MTALQIIQALSVLEAAVNAGADLAPALQKIASNQSVTLQDVQTAIAQTDKDLAAEQKAVNS